MLILLLLFIFYFKNVLFNDIYNLTIMKKRLYNIICENILDNDAFIRVFCIHK